MNVKPLLALTASFLWLLPVDVIADADPSNGEQRCDDLGANCICAEALNTNLLSGPWNGAWYDPTDSTSRECAMAVTGGVNYSIETTSTPVVYSDASALAALPAGHSINYFIGGPVGGNGIFKIGDIDSGIPYGYSKRVAVRFYVYYSSDYEFGGDGICENAKLMGINLQNIDHTDGQLKLANMLTTKWTYNSGVDTVGDCCGHGPPGTGVEGFTNTTKATLRGDWHRYELIITNLAGGLSPNGTHFEMYWKNITEDKAEVKVIDTMEPCVACGPDNSWLGEDDLTPSSAINKIFLNFYRQNTCAGWKAASHVLYAGWDTDEGQRIGSAQEIEGVAGEIESIRPKPPVIFQ